MSGPLIRYLPFKRAHDVLHRLWSTARDNGRYDKKEWLELETAIIDLARRAQKQEQDP